MAISVITQPKRSYMLKDSGNARSSLSTCLKVKHEFGSEAKFSPECGEELGPEHRIRDHFKLIPKEKKD